MAFLCPSRRGRQKKKHKEPKPPYLGRITGSSSVDTLVRVGLEKQHGLTPEARVSVTQDFLATTPGELSARRGDHVYRLYKEGDWVYVITELGQEGFVPAICLNEDAKKKIDKDANKKTHAKNFQRTASVDGRKIPKEHSSFPKGSLASTEARYSLRDAEKERKDKGFFDASMRTGVGSDISSTSSHSPVSLSHQINPLPKPARTHSIPDVVSTASDSVNLDSKHRILNIDKNKTNSISSSSALNDIGKNPSKNSPKHNKNDNGDKLQHHRTTQSSNVLELPLMKAGARDSHTSNGDSITEVKTFVKRPGRKIVVVFPFNAPEENDLKVQKGEVVIVLNEKDPDWVWVRTKNGNEGFVPKSFTSSIPDDLLKADDNSQARTASKPSLSRNQLPNSTKLRSTNFHDVRELTTVHDFLAQSADDISVKKGEQVFADLANQIEEDWLWVYAPGSQSYGYIPKTNVNWNTNNNSSTETLTGAIVNVSVNTNGTGKPV